jgi:DNA-binding NarL/FixJ family response regulator
VFTNKVFREVKQLQLKKKTRILFIDDQDRCDIINYLKEEGWQARLLQDKDFKAIDNTEIKDAHIICVDIKGVGVQLKKENEGLDIAASIKKRFPQKKIILYSSQATHDIFHEANSLIDKRIFKSSGDFEIFRNDIESLSKDIFNWDNMVLYSFNYFKDSLPSDMTFEKFQSRLKKIIKSKSIDETIISSKLSVAANVAQIISLILLSFKS